MDAAALVTSLHDAVPGVTFELVPGADRHATVYLAADDVARAMQGLRDAPSLRFTFLAELTAVDFWPREPRFEVVYLLVSIQYRLRLRVKVRLEADAAHIATVSGIWPGANWLEREVWDLFGVVFDGHPDPRRLLMPEDWEGYPLRKDYPVQIRKTPDVHQPIQVTEEEFRANLQKDRLARK